MLRSKVFPHSPFTEDSGDDSRSPSASLITLDSTRASSPSRANSSSRKPDKTARRTQDDPGKPNTSRSRSRSLSVTLAQDSDARRAGSVGAKKRLLNREVSMSRNFKPKPKPTAKEDVEGPKPAQKRQRSVKQLTENNIGMTLVEATPVKSKVRPRTFQGSPMAAMRQDTRRSFVGSDQEEEEIWVLPGSSSILLHDCTPDPPDI